LDDLEILDQSQTILRAYLAGLGLLQNGEARRNHILVASTCAQKMTLILLICLGFDFGSYSCMCSFGKTFNQTGEEATTKICFNQFFF
jgi:hypothetical protein